MSAVFSLFLATALAAGGQQSTRSARDIPCRSADAVAQMGGISPSESTPRRDAQGANGPEFEPKLIRQGYRSKPLIEVDYICKDDEIYNPPNSGKVVTVFVDGRAVLLKPSATPHSIEAPGWLSRLFELGSKIGQLTGSYDNRRHRFEEAILKGDGDSPTIVRTTGGDCSLLPGVAIDGNNFVLRSEKTVYLGVFCAPGARLPNFGLKSRTSVKPVNLRNGIIEIAIEQDCPDSCELQIINSDGTRAATINISPVSAIALDNSDARLLDDPSPVGGALVGMRLMRQPGWALGGASMLWSRACALPAAAGVAAATYRVSPRSFCTGAGTV